jgi:serine/threonine protein phosphatase PrpC
MLRDKLVASLDAGINGMELSNVARLDSTITKVVKQLDGVFVKEAKVGLLSLSLNPEPLTLSLIVPAQCLTLNPKLNGTCPVSKRRQHISQEHKWHDGSTATFVMIQGTHLVCANVGDSRTIMCRLGQAIPLSVDHKPSRPDERDRIIASGGTISTVGVLRWDARFLSSLS